MPERRALVARHQRRAGSVLEPDAAVARAFDSYARYWYELLRLPKDVAQGEIVPHFEIDGYDHILGGLAAGHGAILALPHLGGWEHAAAWMAEQGHDMLAIVEPIEPPALYNWFVSQRHALGLEVVPLGPGASGALLRALRDNRVVCLLSDRDISGDGVEVEFFGERTTLPGGPATLALRTGAALLPAAAYFRGRRDHLALVRPPIPIERAGRLREDVARITQALAHEFEELIRAAPEQWHLMQPNWPSDVAGNEED
jgi:KDO2-lipid IV(A) lauroyltransferase